MARAQPTLDHRVYQKLRAECTPQQLGATSFRTVLKQRLRVSGAETTRRLADARALGRRTSLTGEPLEPELSTLARVRRRG